MVLCVNWNAILYPWNGLWNHFESRSQGCLKIERFFDAQSQSCIIQRRIDRTFCIFSHIQAMLENPASKSQCETFEKDIDAALKSYIQYKQWYLVIYMRIDYLRGHFKAMGYLYVQMWLHGGSCVCMCVLQSELMGNSEATTRLVIRQESMQCSFFESTYDRITSTLWGSILASLWPLVFMWCGGNWTVE